MKKICCVIPARLESSRFPRKIVQPLMGKPLIQWVWESARRCGLFSHISFAIDHPETGEIIDGFGGNWVMTGDNCRNGTERVIDFRERTGIKADVWVNWQADEPFLSTESIAKLLSTCSNDDEKIWTLMRKMGEDEAVDDPNLVKVVTRADGNALYFSRACIPYMKKKTPVFQHIGIYAYSDAALSEIGMGNCVLADTEGLEQLRFLYQGIPIKVHAVEEKVLGVNCPADLALVEEQLAALR